MDFDIIDTLSDEEVFRLYENDIVDGIENGVNLAYCHCFNTAGENVVTLGSFVDGGCEKMQELDITSRDRCDAWCRRNRFVMRVYSTVCWCKQYREHFETYGYIRQCGT